MYLYLLTIYLNPHAYGNSLHERAHGFPNILVYPPKTLRANNIILTFLTLQFAFSNFKLSVGKRAFSSTAISKAAKMPMARP